MSIERRPVAPAAGRPPPDLFSPYDLVEQEERPAPRRRRPADEIAPGPPGWRRSVVLGRAAAVPVALVLAGLLLGRPDLVMLALPFVVAASLYLHRSVEAAPRVRAELRMAAESFPEGLATTVDVALSADADLDVAVVTMRLPIGVAAVDGSLARATTIRAGEEVVLTYRVRVLRWGRWRIGPAVLDAAGAGLFVVTGSLRIPPVGVRALPVEERFAAEGEVPHAVAVLGSHRSTHRGEGVEPSEVRPYAPGDRLRRINWRVSSRSRQLHVTSTSIDRATDVVLVLDALHEARPPAPRRGSYLDPWSDAARNGAGRPGGSSLDAGVRAAAGIAGHYLSLGDAVGVIEYGGVCRWLRPASGRAQYTRLLDWLLDVRIHPEGVVAPSRALGPRVLPYRALVVALTPLLDVRTSELLADLRRRGLALVVVDTLPPAAVPAGSGEMSRLAVRLWRMERAELIARLTEIGAPVVPWAGAGSLDSVLRDVSRMARAPRMLR